MTGQADQAARWALVCSVLDAVLDAPASERLRILDERCAGDPALRDEVVALLQTDTAIDHKLETPLFERAGALFESDGAPPARADPPPGETIGPWRLIEELGRGGMGAVWLAERADGAFEHRVALKLLKRGLDSDAILERFLAERQILARLQHPHIAHLVDGGVAADGRPYFAMERIEGEPITRWCDARRLSVRERLELFLAVADAVQYAHRQLVVHRDLKPSNILVTPQGEAKLLDFGIAKLLDADADRAEAQTLTQLGIRMLTPEYAAPEQLRGEAVTTSTDVYALGVLLYELLSGQRPPPAEADPAAAKPTPRPSTRLTDAAAEARGATRERLRRMLRGDLDTIVLCAMHPAPERRYGSAEAFGADIRRHLERQPVRARPDSLRYRAGKFVARNRLAVVAASLVALTLVGGIFATAWQAREARQQARRAEQVKDFLVTVFEAGSPQEWRGKEPTARELLDAGAKRVDAELSGDPPLHAEMLAAIGSLYQDQGRFDQAEPLLRRSLAQRLRLHGANSTEYADSLYRLGILQAHKGNWKAAEQGQARAVAIFRKRLGDDRQTAAAMAELALTKLGIGNAKQALDLRRQALEMDRRVLGNDHPRVADDLRILASMMVDQGGAAKTAPLFEESLAIDRRLYGVHSVRYANGLNAQAMMYLKTGQLARAVASFHTAAEIYRDARDIINLEDAVSHYGNALCKLGRFDEGERSLRESIALVERNQKTSGRAGIRIVSLGICQMQAGRLADAEATLRAGLAKLESEPDNEPIWIAYALRALADCLGRAGNLAEALSMAARSVGLFDQQYGAGSPLAAESQRVLAELLFLSGQQDRAAALAKAALDTLEASQGGEHPQTLKAAMTLAAFDLLQEHDQQALQRLRRTVPLVLEMGDRIEGADARLLLGTAMVRAGAADRGVDELRGALTERRKLYGERSAMAAEAAILLGAGLLARNGADEAEQLIGQARPAMLPAPHGGLIHRLAATALERWPPRPAASRAGT